MDHRDVTRSDKHHLRLTQAEAEKSNIVIRVCRVIMTSPACFSGAFPATRHIPSARTLGGDQTCGTEGLTQRRVQRPAVRPHRYGKNTTPPPRAGEILDEKRAEGRMFFLPLIRNKQVVFWTPEYLREALGFTTVHGL